MIFMHKTRAFLPVLRFKHHSTSSKLTDSDNKRKQIVHTIVLILGSLKFVFCSFLLYKIHLYTILEYNTDTLSGLGANEAKIHVTETFILRAAYGASL